MDDSVGTSMIDKAESRRIRAQIRHVLLDTRDPIGVRDEPNAHDEFDGYIAEVYDMLVTGAPDSSLVDYLFWAAHDHMGLDASSRQGMLPTVAELRKTSLDAGQDSNV